MPRSETYTDNLTPGVGLSGNKRCSKCGSDQSVDQFYKDAKSSDGLSSQCKLCRRRTVRQRYQRKSTELKAYQKKYRKQNPDKIRQYFIDYRRKNAEVLARSKATYAKSEKSKHQQRYYYQRTKHIRAAKNAQRRRTDCSYRLRYNMSCAIASALRRFGSSKQGASWEKLVGYSKAELRNHLERLWTDGMSWDNYGYSSGAPRWWTVDHERAQAHFTYSTPSDRAFRECWALSNLQPMWSSENFAKGKRDIWK